MKRHAMGQVKRTMSQDRQMRSDRETENNKKQKANWKTRTAGSPPITSSFHILTYNTREI
jgi:hypothetical protein